MTIHIVETRDVMNASPDGAAVTPTPLIDADDVRALLLNLAAGQSVAPCRMSSPVLYYVIEGQGYLRVDDEQAGLQAGSLVVVPAGAVRAISAADPLRVLAVQVL
jgi:quercetin dioxygenase-like cupin family protein